MFKNSNHRTFFKPYTLLLVVAVILIPLSFFLTSSSVDFHINDTMIVASGKQVFWMVSAILLLEWSVYKLFSRSLYSTYLIWFHVIATILAFAYVLGTFLKSNNPTGEIVTWDSVQGGINQDKFNIEITVALLIFPHLLFVINIIAGLMRKRT